LHAIPNASRASKRAGRRAFHSSRRAQGASPRHPRKSRSRSSPPSWFPTHPQDAAQLEQCVAQIAELRPDLPYFDRDEVNIKWDQRLGEGGFCTAYRATWRGARMTPHAQLPRPPPSLCPYARLEKNSALPPNPASALTPLDRSHAQAKRCARASSIPAVCPAPSPRWPLSKVRSRPRPRRRHPTFSTRRTNPSNLPRTSQLSRENRTIPKKYPPRRRPGSIHRQLDPR